MFLSYLILSTYQILIGVIFEGDIRQHSVQAETETFACWQFCKRQDEEKKSISRKIFEDFRFYASKISRVQVMKIHNLIFCHEVARVNLSLSLSPLNIAMPLLMISIQVNLDMKDHCTTDFCIWRTICLVSVRCISSICHMHTTDFAYDGTIFLVPLSLSYPSSPVL